MELLSAARQDNYIVAVFADKHEGAVWLGLATSSPQDAADYLKAHNFEVTRSEQKSLIKEGETNPPLPFCYFVATSEKASGNKQVFTLPIFLIEYVSPGRLKWLDAMREKRMMAHRNTALRIPLGVVPLAQPGCPASEPS